MIRDRRGQKFGRLLVLDIAERRHQRGIIWRCKCECGNECCVSGDKLGSGHTRSCGCLRRELHKDRTGVLHKNWKGGRCLHRRSGYVVVYTNERNNDGHAIYKPEHRLVMEGILGRLLRDDEDVHHKNGVKADNRPENLELWSRSHPRGQRVVDLVKWAEEILSVYDSEALRKLEHAAPAGDNQ